MNTEQAAEKLQESLDYMESVFPVQKRKLATIDLLDALRCGIAALRKVQAREAEPVALTLPYKRGDRIYVVDDRVKKGYRTTRLNYYQVYADNTERSIIVKTTAVEHWYALDEVFPTLEAVKDGVQQMYQKKRESCLKSGRTCSECRCSDCNARAEAEPPKEPTP